MLRDIYFQNPYKQLSLNEIKPDKQGLNLEFLENRQNQNQNKSKNNSFNFQSTIDLLMAGSPLKLDGSMKPINSNDKRTKQTRQQHQQKFPKIKKYCYKLDQEIYLKLQQGDKIDVNFFNDIMQAKYEEKHADGNNLTFVKQRKQKSEEPRKIKSQRYDYPKNLNTTAIQSERYTLSLSRVKETQKKEQSLTNLYSDSREKQRQKNPTDVKIYVGQDCIHIPALLGDPILYEQQKLESFRAQQRLRDKFKINKPLDKSVFLNRSEGHVIYSNQFKKLKTLDENQNQMIDPTEKGETIKVYIKKDKIKVQNPLFSSFINQIISSDPFNSNEKLITNKKSITLERHQELQQKRLLNELQKQNQIAEKKQKQGEDETSRLRDIKQGEEQLALQKLNLRNEKIKLLKQLKNMIQMGESEDKIRAFKQITDNYNSVNQIQEQKKVFIDPDEILRNYNIEMKRKEFQVLNHYNLISKLKNKTTDLIHKNPNQIQNQVFQNVKSCQSKILGKVMNRKTISFDLQRQLKTDFKQILKQVDVSISKYT